MWGLQLKLSSIKSVHRRGCPELPGFLERTPPPLHAHVIYRVNFVLWPQHEPAPSPSPTLTRLCFQAAPGTPLPPAINAAEPGWAAPGGGFQARDSPLPGLLCPRQEMGQELKLPPEAGGGLSGAQVSAQENLAITVVGMVPTSGGSFRMEPAGRPWREGGWDGPGGSGWALQVIDAAMWSGNFGGRRLQA